MKKAGQYGDRVKQARLKKGFTQRYLAEQIGTMQQTIQRIEANLVKMSTFTVPIAKVLDVSAEWLQYGSKVPLDAPPSYHQAMAVQQSDIPLLEWSEVKDWCKNYQAFALSKSREFISLRCAGPRAYALRLTNDAMVALHGQLKSFHKGG